MQRQKSPKPPGGEKNGLELVAALATRLHSLKGTRATALLVFLAGTARAGVIATYFWASLHLLGFFPDALHIGITLGEARQIGWMTLAEGRPKPGERFFLPWFGF